MVVGLHPHLQLTQCPVSIIIVSETQEMGIGARGCLIMVHGPIFSG